MPTYYELYNQPLWYDLHTHVENKTLNNNNNNNNNNKNNNNNNNYNTKNTKSQGSKDLTKLAWNSKFQLKPKKG